MFYKPKNYELFELVPPVIFKERGERAWELLDSKALVTMQTFRETFGRTVVNDWYWGGRLKESGLRDYYTLTGAKLSQHKFGRAFDLHPREVTIEEAYEYILKNPEKFPYLTTLEDIKYTPGWLHMDNRNHTQEGIWIVKP